MKTKPRNREFDIIRGILIVLIIFRHCDEILGLHVYGGSFFQFFCTFSESVLLVFLLFSGYFYAPKESVGKSILYKFKKIIVPAWSATLLFSLTYLLRYVILGEKSLVWWLTFTVCNLLGILDYNPFLSDAGTNLLMYAVVPLWYLFELFSAFVVFIPLHKWLEGKKPVTKGLACLALLGIAMLFYIFDPQNLLVDTYGTHWSYFCIPVNIFGFAGMLFLGNLLRELPPDSLAPRKKWLAFGVSAVLFALLFILYDTTYAFQYGKWGPYGVWSIPISAVSSLLLFCFLYGIATLVEKSAALGNALAFLGKNSMSYLLLHMGIAELVAWILGFGCNIYYVPVYPEELFAWWHVLVLYPVVFLSITGIVRARKQSAKI